MLLQNDDMNGGNYFVKNRRIYDDVFVDEYVSHFDTKHFMPIMLDVHFFEEHCGIMLANIILDYEMVDSIFSPFIEYHFVIDEEWYNKHYGEDSNKVLRTLSTGQSDITRHEAYTKAQGLNWANANAPKYTNNTNSHEYVDLGLPSGTLWAKMNVGAKSETDPGLYFAWGETEGYADASTKAFSWSDYKFNPSGDGSTFTKYKQTDGKTVLDLEDDAASINMGGDWHMPNRAQCIELFKETKNGFVTSGGAFTQYAWNDADSSSSPTSTTAAISGWDTAGYFFFKNTYTSVTEAITAEDYLFIPAAGYCGRGRVNDVGGWGDVWSSSLGTDNVGRAWSFDFDGYGAGVNYSDGRCLGPSVRGVVGEIEDTK